MTQMTIITGDSPNVLLQRMDADLAAAPLPPFEDERIVVQSLGMERWVRQQLALRQGCAASLRMPFPAAFCRELSEGLWRDPSSRAAGIDARFEEQGLVWRVFALLQNADLLARPVFDPLRTFLDDADEAKRYGLAQRIAARLDEYRLYRPDLLLGWEAGADGSTGSPHEAWQAALWLAVLDGERPQHFARWFTRTIAQLEAAQSAPSGLPARVSVFGVSTLPPLFVRLLRAVARFVPVRVYVLLPDPQSWQAETPRHPLFESFGQASRDLLATLTAADATGTSPLVEHVATTRDRAPATVLERLQHDLRAARASAPFALTPHDRSVSVHACYSPMREMEMLRDQLLDAFAHDSSLRPHDVLVMVPDVELYAPLAEAIFGDVRATRARERAAGHELPERPVIPYRVADRTLVREAAPARALLQFLSLVTARCTASEVLGLLAAPVVRRAAGIAPSQLDQITGWVEAAAIRWGYDGATRRSAFDLPAVDDNSWRLGLDRLLTGYATGRLDDRVQGLLPVAGDLVGDTELLGQFADWVDQLFARLAALRSERPLTAWSRTLQEAVRWLVQADGADELAAFDRLLRHLSRLGELADTRGDGRTHAPALAPDAPVAFEVVRNWLDTVIGGDEHANNFLAGGVTICAMKPMRAIPHRVIAMLGLDDKAYPRRQRRAAFDLIGCTPTLGDRDPRSDDRQLVLDTLMSAGDRLLLSYVGRSQQNNAEVAPSIVIAELLDFLDTQCTTSTGRARDTVCVHHRLQPFSPAYFSREAGRDERLFSFDTALARSVATAAASDRPDAPPFLTTVPAVPSLVRDLAHVPAPAERAIVTVADLYDAWVNPSRLYCRRVLQLVVRGDDPVLEDVEPMAVDALLSTRVQQDMVEQVLNGRPITTRDRELAATTGTLPAGALGPRWFEALQREVAPLLHRLGTPDFDEPLSVDVTGADWQLVGQLEHQRGQEQWRVRAATLKTRDRVRAWIAHVIRNAAGAPATTRVFAKDTELVLPPLADALALLDLLVQGYRAAVTTPLPYFPEAAAAYREAMRDEKKQLRAQELALAAFEADGTFGVRGDLTDPYVATLWRGRQPLDECWDDFRALTDLFWIPLEAASGL